MGGEMRAREPDIEGFLDRNGIKVGYAVYGDGPITIVFAPAWLPVDSRLWKAQVPYLSRHFRVITVDPRGNGRSDQPRESSMYGDADHADDLVAALDAAGVERAVAVGLSRGSWRSILAAARHPERFDGVVALASTIPHLVGPPPSTVADPTDPAGPSSFDIERETYVEWQRFNRHYWRRDYREFLEFFFAKVNSEPHSTKQREDCIAWGLGADGEILAAAEDGPSVVSDRASVEAVIRLVSCPMLVIHGDRDEIQPVAVGERLAELTGAELIIVRDGGHALAGRHPVAVNRWIRDFVRSLHPPVATTTAVGAGPRREWTRAANRERKVLYLSSPIGLGHARRDAAIAAELRRLHPDVRIDWLAQHPVTALLAARGERIHPASRHLASESAHWESEADEHDLHAFQSVRRMDEILAANFMVFADIAESEHYDLWVGDESWEVDHFLHENPELKRSPYVWLTDFVGWLPMPDGGVTESALTTDYNAEMIEQIARYPRLRDRSLFVGNADDVVPDGFGTGLPAIADWTRDHYDFTGYITGFDPAEIADREAMRAEFGWSPYDRVCVVTVGGTGVGAHLLRRAIAAYPDAAARVPGLRMVVVTGPRIDPASLPNIPGLDIRPYVPDLHRYLAAADLAVVQGGLTTTMELAAAGRPFLYVPLQHHFEQQFHVPHRLARYGAGRRLDYAETQPESFAAAIAEEIARPVAYRPVETDGAARAAAYLADLL
jgi:pimeloyl-ACP methyl ester carboxylesterase/predicted glycosyltransferase